MSDKELIKEEIERLKDCASPIVVCDTLLNLIDSLPEEPASEDLEEEMIRWHKEHFGNKRDWGKTSGEYLTRKSQLDLAHHFAEWQKQKDMQGFLEKACEWLSNRIGINQEVVTNEEGQPLADSYIQYLEERAKAVKEITEDFKNYMKDDLR